MATLSTNVVHQPTSSNVNEYKAPSDRIWGDVIKHERLLEQNWHETWENTLATKKNITSKPSVPPCVNAFYQPNPSPSIPPTASAMVGWRSSNFSNSMEYFNVQYKSNKKRFVKEQLGHYRALKYYQEKETIRRESDASMPIESRVKHVPKRLVC